jgi:hypothetical protein
VLHSSILKWILAIGAFSLLAGCGKINIKWDEQVRMVDGETLLVHRTAQGEKLYPYRIGDPTVLKLTEISLNVTQLPKDWEGPPAWQTDYVPVLLDYQKQQNIWSLVVTFAYCEGWVQLGRPALPYAEYQSQNNQPWQRIPLEERLIGRATNLWMGPQTTNEIPTKLVTIKETDASKRQVPKKYQEIVGVWNGIGTCH